MYCNFALHYRKCNFASCSYYKNVLKSQTFLTTSEFKLVLNNSENIKS